MGKRRHVSKKEENGHKNSRPTRVRAPKSPKLFEGEHHGVLWVPGKGFERANYMGPGTNVFPRLVRGDKGKTPIDVISKLHDIDYTLASGTARSEKEQVALVRQADERMISKGWETFKKGKENVFNLVEGAGLIKAKTWLEDWGLLSPTKFLSPRSFKYKIGTNGRDASEYELLLRARTEIVCDRSGIGDKGECDKTSNELRGLQ